MSPSHDTVSDVANDVILQSGLLAEQYGLPRIAGEICGLLFMTDGPLSLDQITETLKVSKASVSTNVRLLERLRFLKRGDVREGKRDYYVFAGEVWDVTGDQLRTTIREELQTLHHQAHGWHQRLRDIPRPAEAKAAASVERIVRRMSELEKLYDLLVNLVSILSANHKLSPSMISHLWKAASQFKNLRKKGDR